MMFLQKQSEENSLTSKQQYLIKYLFGDFATKNYKEKITDLEQRLSQMSLQMKDRSQFLPELQSTYQQALKLISTVESL